MSKNDIVGQFKIDSEMKRKWSAEAESEHRTLPSYIINAVECYRKNGKNMKESIIDWDSVEGLIGKGNTEKVKNYLRK